MRLLRAGQRSAPPLNCGVRRLIDGNANASVASAQVLALAERH
jgi:hypothetical protein